MWPMFASGLQALDGLDYDLYVTMPMKNDDHAQQILNFKNDAHIIICPNRGRDVLPFVHLARRLMEVGYEYVLKLHSKKSTHRADGNLWMEDMLRKLIPPTNDAVRKLISLLEQPTTGIIGPDGHYVSLAAYFGSNKSNIIASLDGVVGHNKADKVVKDVEAYGFFAGTMFWARLDAIAPILDRYYQPSDFESESGQIDATLAHALERLFSLVPEINDQKMYAVNSGDVRLIDYDVKPSKDYTYATNG